MVPLRREVISFVSIIQMNKEEYHITGDLSQPKVKMMDSNDDSCN